MKKLLLLIVFIMSALTALSKEIIPEYYVMERLLMTIEDSPVYQYVGTEQLENFQEIKAIQVDKKVLKSLGTAENPFYMVNSNNEVTAVRVGDYIASPKTLSTVYFISKDSFEKNYRDPSIPNVSLETAAVNTMTEQPDVSEVDEVTNKIDAVEQ